MQGSCLRIGGQSEGAIPPRWAGGWQLHGSLGFLARPPPAAALPKLAAAGEPGGPGCPDPAVAKPAARLGWVIAGCCSSPCVKLREALWAQKGPLAWCPCLTPLVGRAGGSCAALCPSPQANDILYDLCATRAWPALKSRESDSGACLRETKLADELSGQRGTVWPVAVPVKALLELSNGPGFCSCQPNPTHPERFCKPDNSNST